MQDLLVDIMRIEQNHQYGTFGILLIQREAFCVTLEPPWYWNMQNISCIPAGQYLCSRYHSDRYDTYEIRHVPNRDKVLFHPGNIVKNTEGCILVAQYFGKLRGDRAVLNSGATFKAMMDIIKPRDTFLLTIKDCL